MALVRHVRIDGKLFTITYDNDLIVDTIEHKGKLMASNHRYCQRILRHADEILRFKTLKGIEVVT